MSGAKRLMLRIGMGILYFGSCLVHLLTGRLEQVTLILHQEKNDHFLTTDNFLAIEVVVRINESMCIRRFNSPSV